jgi:hypothetical protein
MNKRQVIILWSIAAALGVAVAVVKISQNQSAHSATRRAQGQTLFESFPAAEAVTIEIKGAKESVTLTKKDQKWIVVQRDNFPANNTFVNDLLRTLGDLKVKQGMEAGPSFAPRFGMDENASSAADHGLTVSFKDTSSKEIAKVSLGKNIETAASAPMMEGGANAVGRYIRNHADESGFYSVNEMFPSVSSEAKRWLASDFINPEKIKSISVTAADQAEPAWKLTRDTEEAEFVLINAPVGKVLNTTSSAPLKTLFSYARFDDVVPANQVAMRSAEQGKRRAVIETTEGFTYTVHLTPSKATESKPDGADPQASDNYLLTVEVSAVIPSERTKEADEKPEDAKTKDTAFTERQKTLQEKLAKEKSFAGITFEVSKSLVEDLLKDRDALTTDATPTPEPSASQSNVQELPGGIIAGGKPGTGKPVEAFTPPISVPSTSKSKNSGKKKK